MFQAWHREKVHNKDVCMDKHLPTIRHGAKLKVHLWNGSGSYWFIFTTHPKKLNELFYFVKKSVVESRNIRFWRKPHYFIFVDEEIKIQRRTFISLKPFFVVIAFNKHLYRAFQFTKWFSFHCFIWSPQPHIVNIVMIINQFYRWKYWDVER